MLHAPLALLAGLFAVSITVATPEGYDSAVSRDTSPVAGFLVAGLR